MGLFSQWASTPETKAEPVNLMAPKPKKVEHVTVFDAKLDVVPPDVPANPCDKCGAPAVWRDHWGVCRCPVCDPAPSRASTESVWEIIIDQGERFWVPGQFIPYPRIVRAKVVNEVPIDQGF